MSRACFDKLSMSGTWLFPQSPLILSLSKDAALRPEKSRHWWSRGGSNP